MEVSVINRIGEFDKLSSFFSRVFSINGITNVLQPFSFWKLGVFIVVFAIFRIFLIRLHHLIVRFRSHDFQLSKPLITHFEEDDGDYDDTSSEEDDDDDDDDDDEDDAKSSSDSDYDDQFEESECENNNFKLRRCFSWSDFAKGKSVVKLWDGLGLGLGLNFNLSKSPRNLLSIYDLNQEQQISSISQFPVMSASSLALKAWDLRVGCKIPVILADWNHVGDDDFSGEISVGDLRNVNSPLKIVKEYGEDNISGTGRVPYTTRRRGMCLDAVAS